MQCVILGSVLLYYHVHTTGTALSHCSQDSYKFNFSFQLHVSHILDGFTT